MDKLDFTYYDASNKDVDQYMREHDICTDDYDYTIFSECNVKGHQKIRQFIENQFLHGCCSNETCYVEDFFGKNGVLGGAYHA